MAWPLLSEFPTIPAQIHAAGGEPPPDCQTCLFSNEWSQLFGIWLDAHVNQGTLDEKANGAFYGVLNYQQEDPIETVVVSVIGRKYPDRDDTEDASPSPVSAELREQFNNYLDVHDEAAKEGTEPDLGYDDQWLRDQLYAECLAYLEPHYQYFVADVEEVAAMADDAAFDYDTMDAVNETVLKAAQEGKVLSFLQFDHVVLIQPDRHSHGFNAYASALGASEGKITIQSRGGTLSHGTILVEGPYDEDAFKGAVRRVSKKSVKFR